LRQGKGRAWILLHRRGRPAANECGDAWDCWTEEPMPYTVTSDEEEWRVEERRQVRSRFEELLTVMGE
jgi:hypothetical protein